MSKVQITLGFDTFAEALRVLAAIDGTTAGKEVTGISGGAAGYVIPSKEATTTFVQAQGGASGTNQPNAEKPAEQTPSGVTQDDVRKSFAEYVGKGGGRTAATGKAILTRFGVPSVREAPVDKWAGLKRAFDTAGPELPLGE